MRRWMCSLSGISTLVWLGTVSVVPMLAEEPVVPVYHEPHHRQVFQYGSTRILDVQVPPGERIDDAGAGLQRVEVVQRRLRDGAGPQQ